MSTKQYLIDSINAETAKASNLKLEDYVKAAQEGFAADRDAEKGVINSTHDASKAYVQAVNDKAVTDTKADYDSQYERNAVQKLINEKQVAEKMANLGLTDSGLNRTQQTAVQLSYANQKGKLDLARQSALDDLALNLTSALTEIETNRSADLLAADQKWNDKGYSVGQTNYNNDLSAINDRITSAYEQYGDIAQAEIDVAVQKAAIEAAAQKAAIEASGKAKENENNKILWYYTGTYDEDDNPIFRNSEGKTQAFGAGVNPYTGTKHKDVKHGTFSNGYQPNHITITTVDEKGKKIVAPKKLYSQPEYEVYVNGKKQQVWSYDNGETLWAWDGSINDYVDVTSQRDDLKKNGGN